MSKLDDVWARIQRTAGVLQQAASLPPGPELGQLAVSHLDEIGQFKEDIEYFLANAPMGDARTKLVAEVKRTLLDKVAQPGLSIEAPHLQPTRPKKWWRFWK